LQGGYNNKPKNMYVKYNIYTPKTKHNEFENKSKFLAFMTNLLNPTFYSKHKEKAVITAIEEAKERLSTVSENITELEKELEEIRKNK
jgi:uncharacterized protein (DUF2164 family)